MRIVEVHSSRKLATIVYCGLILTIGNSSLAWSGEISSNVKTQRGDSEIKGKLDVINSLHREGLLSDKDFEREHKELVVSAKLYTNKCPPAAFVPGKIRFSFKKKDEDRAHDLIQNYGFQAHIGNQFDTETEFGSLKVEEGHEWFWVDALLKSGIFDSVERQGYACQASVDDAVGLHHPQMTLLSPSADVGPVVTGPAVAGPVVAGPAVDASVAAGSVVASSVVAGAPALQGAFAQVKANFPSPAHVNVLQSNPGLLKLEVTGIKGRVLVGKRLWERLEIYLVALPSSSANSPAPIRAIVDGYFATGLSDSPPDSSAYQSMQQAYYVELARFTNMFFNKL